LGATTIPWEFRENSDMDCNEQGQMGTSFAMNSSDHVNDWARLIEGARQGDSACLSQLAERVEHRLLGYLYRLTLNYDLSQELTQQTLLKMIRSIDTLEHVDRFWGWLFRSAMGELQHHFRDTQRRQKAEMARVCQGRLPLIISSGAY